MCKVLLIPGIKESTSEKAFKFAEKMSDEMTRNDRDGLGYAAMTKNGELFGERWLKPFQAWNRREVIAEEDRKAIAIVGKDGVVEEPEEVYNSFGNASLENRVNTVGLIVHARLATCAKNLMNVHPFVRDNTALIHNGVIHNHEELLKKVSTCDSEVILNEYVDFDVNINPQNIKEMIPNLNGYYACGVLTLNEENIPTLDVFKNPQANLHCTYVNELETVVFSTSKDMIESALRSLGWKINTIFTVRSGKMLRFNLLKGRVETYVNFDYSANTVTKFDQYRRHKHKTQATNSSPIVTTEEYDYSEWGEDADYAAIVHQMLEREEAEEKMKAAKTALQ